LDGHLAYRVFLCSYELYKRNKGVNEDVVRF